MSELFQELKRRNVVRVGAAYAVVTWLVLQVVDTVAPLMGMPDWVPGFVLILLGVGFPIALLFSWAYEITPEGLKKTEEVDVIASVTADTGRKIDRVIIAGLALLVIFLIGERFLGGSTSSGPRTLTAEDASIAVLPFVNMSSDEEQEFFSDGISEELLNVLAQVPDLRVAARTSSFQFKGDNRDVTEIAQQLNVRHILEGSVRKSGETVRITAQLIDASDGFHLWSETYDRSLENVFAVQDEISSAIATALRTEMGLDVVEIVREVPTEVPEAHEAYLRGRHLVVQRTRASIEGAVEEFRRAIDLDPNYAVAHAELSLAWHLLEDDQYGSLDRAEVLARAEPSAFTAIALDEGLAEAQAARGFVEWQRRDFDQALAAFGAALEINPNYVDVHTWTSNLLTDDLGRYQEAEERQAIAAALDPLSIPANANVAREMFEQGRLDDAEEAIGKLEPLSPALAVHIRAEHLSVNGSIADGGRMQLDALTIDPTSTRIRNFLGFDLIRMGLLAEAERTIGGRHMFIAQGGTDRSREVEWAEEWVERLPGQPGPESDLGLAYAGAGDLARARPLLEGAWELAAGNVSRFGLFSPFHGMALVAARQADGDDVAEIVAAVLEHSRQLDAVGSRAGGPLLDRAIGLWLSGDRDGAMTLVGDAVDGGAVLFLERADWSEVTAQPGFAEIRERYEAHRASERADFLDSVCSDNPWADVWTPLPETCAGR
ncbi:MAG: FlgO family outer membrane protein [Gemmatimonadota bacterium]